MPGLFYAFRTFTLDAQVESIPTSRQVPTLPRGCRNESCSMSRNPNDRFVGAPSVHIL